MGEISEAKHLNRIAGFCSKSFSLALSWILISCHPASVYKREVPEPGAAQSAKGGAFLNPMVDILFVIDNSGSMGSYQTQLSQAADLFVQGLSQWGSLNYRVAVTTTDHDSRGNGHMGTFVIQTPGPAVISKSTPNGLLHLKSNLIPGISGSGTEKLFDPLYSVFDPKNLAGANQGFYRPDAFLAIIFITDTGDQSTANRDPMALAQFLWGLKSGDRNRVLVYGAFADTLSKTYAGLNCRGEGEGNEKTLEIFFQAMTSNPADRIFSLCDPQFGKRLADFGKDISNKVGGSIYLDRLPTLETLIVRIGGVILPKDPRIGWSYNARRNSIELGNDINWSDYPINTRPEVDYIPLDEADDFL